MNKPFIAILIISLILNLLLAVLFIQELGSEALADDPNEINNIDLESTPDSLTIVGAGVISTRLGERDFSLSAQGDELFFTQSNFDHSIRVIMTSRLLPSGWSTPAIASFSGEFNDIEPFLAPDRQRLYFASDRLLDEKDTLKDYNIWYTDRADNTWKLPLPLSEVINSDGDEFYPSVSKNGNLYFTASLPYGIGSEDIYLSEFKEGVYQKPEPLDTTVNSATYEFNAYISPDENLLFFSSFGRADDLGGGDLYFSEKDELGNWTSAKHLKTPINSRRLDYCPFLHMKSNTLYFTSNRRASRPEKYTEAEDILSDFDQILNGMDNIYKIKFDKTLID